MPDGRYDVSTEKVSTGNTCGTRQGAPSKQSGPDLASIYNLAQSGFFENLREPIDVDAREQV
jgi:hypothetical protein